LTASGTWQPIRPQHWSRPDKLKYQSKCGLMPPGTNAVNNRHNLLEHHSAELIQTEGAAICSH